MNIQNGHLKKCTNRIQIPQAASKMEKIYARQEMGSKKTAISL